MRQRASTGSSASKVKVASSTFTTPDGPPVMVTVGAVVSTVQDRVTGTLTLPYWSVARTWNW